MNSNQPLGSLALVGSGEYTPEMQKLEENLLQTGIANGKTAGYVQFATAAGEESEDRIEYWKNLGRAQAERIGVQWKFVPLLDRSEIDNPEFVELVKGASLIYFSGGNPVHLARTFHGSQLLNAIKSEFLTGTSLAGCSAGAMAMTNEAAIHWRKQNESHDGFGILPKMKIFPHYDRYFGKIPSPIRNLITRSDEDEYSIGIDEFTALVWDKNSWVVKGKSAVHLLSNHEGRSKDKFYESNELNFLPSPIVILN